MASSTVTTQGQATIPKEIREFLAVRPGDRVEFLIEESGRVIVLPANVSVKDLEGILPRPKRPVPIKKMDRDIRKRASVR